MPDWIVGELVRAYGDAAEAEALALRDRAATTVRPTLGKGGAEACAAGLAAEGFATAPGPHGTLIVTGPGDPFATKTFAAGHFVPQDPASLAVVDLLGDVAGRRVADLCAGRGLKATALADRGAEVVALDVSAAKLEELRALAAQLGVADRVTTRVADLAEAPPDIGTFDFVLVDAPCTGLGTLRRHPEIAWRRRPEDLASLVALQDRLMANAAPLVAPGGVLVWAVCSFARAEGAPAVPSGLVEEAALDLRPSAGLDAFQARRLRRGPPS
ncbi:MAG: RsmB/NOP family class I SAM-dependent RNA methyltransferase [Deltaproteobacteria bacterium]|nr:MAG: RsmB/NOP family class I SAM-dependent RNA methyltransferase [Deltaproteobacteria bacterium]